MLDNKKEWGCFALFSILASPLAIIVSPLMPSFFSKDESKSVHVQNSDVKIDQKLEQKTDLKFEPKVVVKLEPQIMVNTHERAGSKNDASVESRGEPNLKPRENVSPAGVSGIAGGNPGFYLQGNNAELSQTFKSFFNGLGLRLVTDSALADYLIDVSGDYRSLKHPADGTDGVQLSLWIRICDHKNGKELLHEKNDPRQSAVFYASGERRKEIAAEKALAQMKKPLQQALNDLIGQMASSGRDITIIVEGYSDAFAKPMEQFFCALERIPGCGTFTRKVDGLTQTVTLRGNYKGKMNDLECLLQEHLRKEVTQAKLRPKTKSIESNRLILSF